MGVWVWMWAGGFLDEELDATTQQLYAARTMAHAILRQVLYPPPRAHTLPQCTLPCTPYRCTAVHKCV